MTTRYLGMQKAPIAVRNRKSSPRRLDLSVPFTVTLIAGFTSGSLFLAAALRHELPLGRLVAMVIADPFGALTLALLAAAVVMARIGDI